MKNENKYITFLVDYRDIIINSETYYFSKESISNSVNFDGNNYKIYNNWIDTLFWWNNHPLCVKPKLKEELRINIDSARYVKCYVEGYKKGQAYILNEYINDEKETQQTLVEHLEDLDKVCHEYFNKEILALNDDVSKDHGYYAAIHFEILKFKEKKPCYYKDLDKSQVKLYDELFQGEGYSEIYFKKIFRNKISQNFFYYLLINWINGEKEPIQPLSYIYRRLHKDEIEPHDDINIICGVELFKIFINGGVVPKPDKNFEKNEINLTKRLTKVLQKNNMTIKNKENFEFKLDDFRKNFYKLEQSRIK